MRGDGTSGVEGECLFLLGGDWKISWFVCFLSHGRKGKLCVLVVKLLNYIVATANEGFFS
jgi:hypothetical protein